MLTKKGFTLIELIMIIVILGILAVTALPRYFDLRTEARESAVKGALGGLRSGISIWYAHNIATSGTTAWPALSDLTATTGGVMINGSIPDNPYNTQSAVTTAASGTVLGDYGWVYNTTNGRIWGNTTDSSAF